MWSSLAPTSSRLPIACGVRLSRLCRPQTAERQEPAHTAANRRSAEMGDVAARLPARRWSSGRSSRSSAAWLGIVDPKHALPINRARSIGPHTAVRMPSDASHRLRATVPAPEVRGADRLVSRSARSHAHCSEPRPARCIVMVRSTRSGARYSWVTCICTIEHSFATLSGGAAGTPRPRGSYPDRYRLLRPAIAAGAHVWSASDTSSCAVIEHGHRSRSRELA